MDGFLIDKHKRRQLRQWLFKFVRDFKTLAREFGDSWQLFLQIIKGACSELTRMRKNNCYAQDCKIIP
jgi:hypothetical protein